MKKGLVTLMVFGAVWASLRGEIRKVSAEAFSPEVVVLSFSGFRDGVAAGEIFSEWGVRFRGGGVAIPRIRKLAPGFVAAGSEFTVLRKEDVSGDLAGGTAFASASRKLAWPLVLDFEFPVKRVGFSVGNGGAAVAAVIQAFDASGNALGIVEQQRVDSFIGPFVGIEAAGDDAISKLTVDYGDVAAGEQISRLTLEYLSRPAGRS